MSFHNVPAYIPDITKASLGPQYSKILMAAFGPQFTKKLMF